LASDSSQPIRLEVIAGDRYLERADCPADVIVTPALDLAELADREWISPLQQNLTRLADGPTGSSASRRRPPPNSTADADGWDALSDASSGVWPEAWRAAASYGRRMWGVPLGVPAWTLLIGQSASTADQPPSGQGASGVSTEDERPPTWATLPASPEPTATGLWSIASEADTQWLVERFLAMLSQQSLSPGSPAALLDISDTQPRLDDPLVIETAHAWVELVRRSPLPFGDSSAWLAPPEQAWQAVADGVLPWAIAWPAPELGRDLPAGDSRQDRPGSGEVMLRVRPWPQPEADAAQTAAPIASAQAMVACIGFRTRQSALASFFLEWLNEPGQRRSLSRHSWRISPLPDAALDAGAPMERLEYRQFAALSWQANQLRPELQLAGARRYRQLLGQALLTGIDSPQQLPTALQRCAQQWRELTEQFGVSTQRRSYERSLGLRS
jgi:hypothetical protein